MNMLSLRIFGYILVLNQCDDRFVFTNVNLRACIFSDSSCVPMHGQLRVRIFVNEMKLETHIVVWGADMVRSSWTKQVLYI